MRKRALLLISWLPKHRLEGLVYAASSGIFLLLPLLFSAYYGLITSSEWMLVLCQLGFLLVYLTLWCLNDAVVDLPKIPLNLLVGFMLLILFMTGAILVAPVGGIFDVVYFVPLTLLLVPNRWIKTVYILVSLGVLTAAIAISWEAMPVVLPLISSFLGTTLVMFNIRKSIWKEKHRQLEVIRKRQQAIREERERMAADLHDILGQNLTAIATLSELTVRLIQNNQTGQAIETTQQIRVLSREALRQMRTVIHSRQTLTIAGEISGAQLLAENTRFDLQIIGVPPRLTPEAENIMAHVIRESITNLLRHSQATWCQIEFAPDTLTITNNGIINHQIKNGIPVFHDNNDESKIENNKAHGLAQLASRVDGIGTLTFGPTRIDSDRWQVKLTVTAAGLL